ncbi:MAG: putative cytochrome c biosis protein [Ilumatobacteraceae bacterium]|nr:putative cytochrome c biosis protein [Ilumatobacteraceae bacterium]
MNLSLSLIRGMVATVNPCGFILLPTYLLYFLGLSSADAGTQRAPIGRALFVSGAVSAGFLAVFLLVGAVSRFFTNWLTANSIYATAVIAVVLIALGIAMLFGYRLPINTPKLDAGGRDRTVSSMFVYGIAYAVASLGCALPLFITTLFGTAKREGYFAGVANVVAYGAGMALVVSALTISLAFANVGLLKALRSGMHYVEMLAGAFVLLSGAYLLWYFWKVDIQEENDPITAAVRRYQTSIGNFLNNNWQPVAGLFALIVAAAVVFTLVDRRRMLSHQAAE